MKVKRGDVIYLDYIIPRFEHIQGGNRPYVVVSNNIGNKHSDICMVCPMTTAKKKYLPTHARIDNFQTVMCEQIFTINQSHIASVKFRLKNWQMNQVDKALKAGFGL